LKKEAHTTETKWRKVNWIGHIFCRNSFLKHVIDGNIEWTRTGERTEEATGKP
jgi:hypothetical protein